MKKPNVLNRSMFNRGGTSAYGRGITSNLVSDEQRQRFNYGGRVGLKNGLMAPFYNPTPWDELPNYKPITTSNTYEVEDDLLSEEGDIIAEGDKEYYDVFPHLFKGRRDLAAEEEKSVLPPQLTPDAGGETFVAEKEKVTNLGGAGTGEMPDSDTINWEEFAEGLYDKKGARGKALLGLAGNVLAASQQPKKEAAAILGKGMGDFGKTFAERKEKMEDIAATGKMYEKVNIAKAAEAGKWAVKAAMVKAGLAGDAFRVFQDSIGKNLGPDKSLFRATGVQTQTLEKGKDDQVMLPGDARPGQVFRTGETYYVADKDGNLSEPTNDIRIVIGLIKTSRL
jgi:hypothetical protein